jgi:hypothetical protein
MPDSDPGLYPKYAPPPLASNSYQTYFFAPPHQPLFPPFPLPDTHSPLSLPFTLPFSPPPFFSSHAITLLPFYPTTLLPSYLPTLLYQPRPHQLSCPFPPHSPATCPSSPTPSIASISLPTTPAALSFFPSLYFSRFPPFPFLPPRSSSHAAHLPICPLPFNCIAALQIPPSPLLPHRSPAPFFFFPFSLLLPLPSIPLSPPSSRAPDLPISPLPFNCNAALLYPSLSPSSLTSPVFPFPFPPFALPPSTPAVPPLYPSRDHFGLLAVLPSSHFILLNLPCIFSLDF